MRRLLASRRTPTGRAELILYLGEQALHSSDRASEVPLIGVPPRVLCGGDKFIAFAEGISIADLVRVHRGCSGIDLLQRARIVEAIHERFELPL